MSNAITSQELTITVSSKDQAAIVRRFKSIDSAEAKFRKTAGECHNDILDICQRGGVPFKDVMSYLRDLLIEKDLWPHYEKELKSGEVQVRPVAVNEAVKQGDQAGIWLNRMRAHHGQFSDYGVVKVKKAKTPPTPPENNGEGEGGEGEGEGTTTNNQTVTKSSKAVTFDKEQISAAIRFLWDDCQSESDLDAVMHLACKYGVEVPEHELEKVA